MGVGSGGTYALAAALVSISQLLISPLDSLIPCRILWMEQALLEDDNYSAEQVARKAMKIAGDICVYTNHNLLVEVLDPQADAAKKEKE